MKIAHLSSIHRSNDIRIFWKECRSLARAGIDVHFVVPHDRDEVIDGVHIHAVPFPKNRLERMTKTVAQVIRKALDVDPDIYHIHPPELLTGAGVLRAMGKKVVYDVHEDFAEQIKVKEWIPTPARKFMSVAFDQIEKQSMKTLNGFFPATPHISRRFPKDKTQVINNFPDLSSYSSELLPMSSRQYDVCYTGTIGKIRGIYEMLDALEIASRKRPVQSLFVGSFESEECKDRAFSHPAWKSVTYIDWISPEELMEKVSQSKLGLMTYHPVGNYIASRPNKLFEYMWAGTPVIASHFKEWIEILGDESNRKGPKLFGAGAVVDPKKPEEIADCILDLLENESLRESMSQIGRARVKESFNWENESKNLIRSYERIVN